MRLPVRTFVPILAVGLTACASSGAVPRPFPSPGGAPISPPSPALVDDPYGITGTALGLRGTPYRPGGSDPSGFDCSGFVYYVFAQHGLLLPRTVADQFRVGRSVKPEDLRPGDLLFFDTSGGPASHVGLAVGGDQFVHAPAAHGEVRVERLAVPYWHDRFVGARRVIAP
jgi:cell wall-associated NlpC family hydrolase